MASGNQQELTRLLADHENDILKDWLARLKADGALDSGRIRESELQTQTTAFLRGLRTAFEGGAEDIDQPGFEPVRELMTDISRSRGAQGFTPRETAVFVLSLKQPLYEALGKHGDEKTRADTAWSINLVLDRLGLFTMENYQKTREELIVRQQQEISELSTPVIKLWEGILALPLIGTLDSQRTQVVMENLLETIVAQGADMAIIDITGVPTVDTLTAQHLLKTVSAARLMGADCIISGIRPQIAQTMVHLGVELNVVSKSTLADAFAMALARQGRTVVKKKQTAAAAAAAPSPTAA